MTRITLILFFTFFSVVGFSQPADPVTWNYTVEKIDNQTANLVFYADIDDNWHLYAQDFAEGGPLRTTFHFDESDKYELIDGTDESPEPEEVYDEIFEMDVKQFSEEATFTQKIKIKSEDDFEITGNVEYQVCQDDRCVYFNPDFAFEVEGGEEVESAEFDEDTETDKGKGSDEKEEKEGDADKSVSAETEELKDDERTASDQEGNQSLIGFFLFSVLLGFAGILTPCVFPMIPMTISFFMQSASARLQGIIKALIFGLSIIILYTSVGLIVSLTSASADFTGTLSTHWIPNLIFFLLFLVFASSFFGLFEIVLPSKLANRADSKVDKGGYLASFFMALTLVLVSFSCTGPIVGALLVKAAGGAVIEPTVGMFGFAVGFGLPFTVLAISPGWLKKLPKSGGWMNSVKVVLAFIILAFAFKFLSNIDQNYHLDLLSRDLYISIWIALFTLLGFYLLGKIKLPNDSDLKNISVIRLVFAIAAFSFAIYLVPGLFGANLNSISGLLPPKSAQQFEITASGGVNEISASETLCEEEPKYSDILDLPYGIKGYFDYEQGMSCAEELDKPVLVYFTGHSCSNCKKMQSEVWSVSEVQRLMNKEYVVIALYVDDRTKLPESEWIESEYDGKVKKTIGKKNADIQLTRFNANTQPYYVILDSDGEQITDSKGYELDPQEFANYLKQGVEQYNEP
ncbi:MAG: protein-disulfide reductase DsbD family protein [Bacteroidales bacterium]